jgi:hypothetical protein
MIAAREHHSRAALLAKLSTVFHGLLCALACTLAVPQPINPVRLLGPTGIDSPPALPLGNTSARRGADHGHRYFRKSLIQALNPGIFMCVS